MRMFIMRMTTSRANGSCILSDIVYAVIGGQGPKSVEAAQEAAGGVRG